VVRGPASVNALFGLRLFYGSGEAIEAYKYAGLEHVPSVGGVLTLVAIAVDGLQVRHIVRSAGGLGLDVVGLGGYGDAQLAALAVRALA
jgi:hypothetical protein